MIIENKDQKMSETDVLVVVDEITLAAAEFDNCCGIVKFD